MQREIAGLFAALDRSGCQFRRNGRWYGATRAHAHLQRKYDYLVAHARVPDAETFITLAATRSSLSGRAYAVRCAGAAEVPSATWFRRELARLRARP